LSAPTYSFPTPASIGGNHPNYCLLGFSAALAPKFHPKRKPSEVQQETRRLAGLRQATWLVCWLAGWPALAGWLAGWPAAWLGVRLAVVLAGCLAGWMAGWLAGWLLG
jgi:hypothetical protein